MRYESVVDAIGHTPVVRLHVGEPVGVEVYAKLELQNLFAMKDRVARQVITKARWSGELLPGAPIIESSSGTMALGLALVGTHFGHPVHIVTDPRIDPITLAKLRTLGCTVHVVEAMGDAGWQSARLARLAELMAGLDGAFWPRQYANPQNPLAYQTLAGELRADLGTLDVLVGAVGSGGSLCGTARALSADLPDLRVVGVDCVGSILFGQPDQPKRRQSGLGNSLQPDNLDYSIIDEVHWLSDEEAFDATRRLAREQKIFGGNTSGSVYRVLSHLAADAAPGTRLVGVLADRGDRYVGSVYGDAGSGTVAGEPVEVRYGTPVSSWSYAKLPRRERPVLLFVESNTTGTGMLALRTVARLGATPVLLTNDPARYGAHGEPPCRVVVCDTNDQSELARCAEAELASAPLAGVTTTSDFYLGAVAGLAASLGVPANTPQTVTTCKDKARARQVLTDRGLLQPRFTAVTRPGQVASAVRKTGLPCVVKPVDGSGSEDVLLCATPAQAQRQAALVLAVERNVRGQASAGAALVEEYAEGPEYSVETFCADGTNACVGITAKHLGGLPGFVESGHDFPAVLSALVAKELEEAARRALDAVGYSWGAAHVEIRLTGRGPLIVEINARLAGGMIPELIRLAVGVDLLEQQLRAAIGLPVSLEPTRSRHAAIRFLLPHADGTLRDVLGVETAARVPGIEHAVLTCEPGRKVRVARDAYDRLGYVVAVGDSPSRVQCALDEALGQIKIVVS
jgi:S-sulfo-L-cysteine synthase (3-phospho-L-serine-dependent)